MRSREIARTSRVVVERHEQISVARDERQRVREACGANLRTPFDVPRCVLKMPDRPECSALEAKREEAIAKRRALREAKGKKQAEALEPRPLDPQYDCGTAQEILAGERT